VKVVVVGAGVGGLAVAARLAAGGHHVTVCEASGTVGGKLGLLERDGFRFDTGPSLLTMPGVFRELFASTGGWPDGLDLLACEPLIRHRFADGSGFDSTADRQVLHDRLEAWSPGAGADWDGLLHRGSRIWEASRKPFLESPLRGPRTLAALAITRPHDLATLAPGRTLRDLGRRHLRDPRLRMLLDRYATYSGSDPRRAPAALAAIPWVEHAYGGWWISGGLRRLADALLDRCGWTPGWCGSRSPCPGSSSRTGSCRPTWWWPMPMRRTSTATSSTALRPPAGWRGQRPRCPASC
jgi:phytoene dehydrogenase-like protein